MQSSSSTTGAGVAVGTARELGAAEAVDADSPEFEAVDDAGALKVAMVGVSVVFGRGVGSG